MAASVTGNEHDIEPSRNAEQEFVGGLAEGRGDLARHVASLRPPYRRTPLPPRMPNTVISFSPLGLVFIAVGKRGESMGKLDGKITIVTGATSASAGAPSRSSSRKAPRSGDRPPRGARPHARGGARQGQVRVRESRRHREARREGDDRCLRRQSGAGSTACSTMPADRRRSAASRPCRSRASMRRWRPWCAR